MKYHAITQQKMKIILVLKKYIYKNILKIFNYNSPAFPVEIS